LKAGTSYEISASKDMQGILILVSAPSGTSTKGVLTKGAGTKVTNVCKSPVAKAVSGVYVDVTVVKPSTPLDVSRSILLRRQDY
jgi:hypothetical protein